MLNQNLIGLSSTTFVIALVVREQKLDWHQIRKCWIVEKEFFSKVSGQLLYNCFKLKSLNHLSKTVTWSENKRAIYCVNIFIFLVSYAGERPWWPIKSPNIEKKKKAKG